jgi:hypothetical protein
MGTAKCGNVGLSGARGSLYTLSRESFIAQGNRSTFTVLIRLATCSVCSEIAR